MSTDQERTMDFVKTQPEYTHAFWLSLSLLSWFSKGMAKNVWVNFFGFAEEDFQDAFIDAQSAIYSDPVQASYPHQPINYYFFQIGWVANRTSKQWLDELVYNSPYCKQIADCLLFIANMYDELAQIEGDDKACAIGFFTALNLARHTGGRFRFTSEEMERYRIVYRLVQKCPTGEKRWSSKCQVTLNKLGTWQSRSQIKRVVGNNFDGNPNHVSDRAAQFVTNTFSHKIEANKFHLPHDHPFLRGEHIGDDAKKDPDSLWKTYVFNIRMAGFAWGDPLATKEHSIDELIEMGMVAFYA